MLSRVWQSFSSSQEEEEEEELSPEEIAAEREAAFQEVRKRLADIIEGRPLLQAEGDAESGQSFGDDSGKLGGSEGGKDELEGRRGEEDTGDESESKAVLPIEVPSDAKIWRFLRAYQYDVDLAATRLRRQTLWRATPAYGLDIPVRDIRADTLGVPEQAATGKAYVLNGTDLKGGPIVVVHVRRHTTQPQGQDDVTRFGVHILESLEARLASLAEAKGLGSDPDADPDSKLCIIFDLSAIAMVNMDMKMAKRIIYMLTHFYPERMGVCLLLSAPALFSAAWMVIRPWLHPRTQERIAFVKPADLSAHLPNEAIPTFWGGGDAGPYPEPERI